MNDSSIWNIASAILLSLGGGGVLVLALSSWIGKLWADKLMARETAAHSRALEELRADLNSAHDRSSHLFKEKLALYKQVAEPLIDLVAHVQSNNSSLASDAYAKFEKDRLKSTALLAMFAPSQVFEQYNAILEYVFDAIDGKEQWSFPEFRQRSLSMLSLMRRDVGLYKDDVSYGGHR